MRGTDRATLDYEGVIPDDEDPCPTCDGEGIEVGADGYDIVCGTCHGSCVASDEVPAGFLIEPADVLAPTDYEPPEPGPFDEYDDGPGYVAIDLTWGA